MCANLFQNPFKNPVSHSDCGRDLKQMRPKHFICPLFIWSWTFCYFIFKHWSHSTDTGRNEKGQTLNCYIDREPTWLNMHFAFSAHYVIDLCVSKYFKIPSDKIQSNRIWLWTWSGTKVYGICALDIRFLFKIFMPNYVNIFTYNKTTNIHSTEWEHVWPLTLDLEPTRMKLWLWISTSKTLVKCPYPWICR